MDLVGRMEIRVAADILFFRRAALAAAFCFKFCCVWIALASRGR